MASVPHDCLAHRRGLLSDRALRPWLEAAVLLILLCCGAFYSLRQTTVQSSAARFPRSNVPRFVATARPFCPALQQPLLGRLHVAGSSSLPWARGHAGRYSPAGAA